MKPSSFLFFLVLFFESAFAQLSKSHDLAIIRSIDDFNPPRDYVSVSEEGLPTDHYFKLIQQINAFRFTLLSMTEVSEFFEDLVRNTQARMAHPRGLCSQRRAYIQNQLKRKNITSGKILVKCPANNGRLRLMDQVSRRYFTYSNFHDTNIVTVLTPSGVAFHVLDLQFQDKPVSLHDYLTEIEASQRIRPLKRKGSTRSLCYWTIGTSHLTF
jgi:hypothetical protein